MLFTPAMLAADFAGLEILKNETASVVLNEGPTTRVQPTSFNS